jgi:hypothetical protein
LLCRRSIHIITHQQHRVNSHELVVAKDNNKNDKNNNDKDKYRFITETIAFIAGATLPLAGLLGDLEMTM